MGVCGYVGSGISFRVVGAGGGPPEGQGSAPSLSGHPPFSRGQALRLTLLGLVCGQTTMAHIALFARMHWPTLKEPLGFLCRAP